MKFDGVFEASKVEMQISFGKEPGKEGVVDAVKEKVEEVKEKVKEMKDEL